MDLRRRLKLIKDKLQDRFVKLSPSYPGCVLFFSLSDGQKKAVVLHGVANTFESAWMKCTDKLPFILKTKKIRGTWLRVDMVVRAETMAWDDFVKLLSTYRRNYFRYGISFGSAFQYALTEQECCANSILYGLNKKEAAEFNEDYFTAYAKVRFKEVPDLALCKNGVMTIFTTTSYFCDEQGVVHLTPGVEETENVPINGGAKADAGPSSALYSGRRFLPMIGHEVIAATIKTSSRYLAKEMKNSGEFNYGYLPGFSSRLTKYNFVRHAGTLFALLDTLEYNHDETLRPVIEKGVERLAGAIREYTLGNGRSVAFLIETNGEIKLGGNGVSLVTLCRWTKFSKDTKYLSLIEKLAEGLAYMQDPATGTFVHILHSEDLSVKSVYRTVYYDGEALFGLMQAYGTTANERWLFIAEKALDAFIELKHWKHHDHWLSYATNEMTFHKPEDKYFEFGIRNITSHIKFILERETTYPTLLELSMAAEKMFRRLENMPEKRHLLKEIDLEKLRFAVRRRAEYLLNGYFWPEVVMYFSKPYQLEGSFFIRHHAFRTRIDDVGHYLCGLVAYDALFTKPEAERQR